MSNFEHASNCWPDSDFKCLGLSCMCGFATCIQRPFDHKCPLAGTNAAWSLFLAIAAFAAVIGLLYR